MIIKENLKSLFYTNVLIRKLYYFFTNSVDQYIKEYKPSLEPGMYQDRALKKKMIHCLLKYGCIYDEFFIFGLYKMEDSEIGNFITDCKRYKYYSVFNSKDDDRLFDNKWDTYKCLKEYYKRDAILVENESDLDKFLQFCMKHPNIIVKQLSLSCGKGVEFYSELDSANNAKNAFEHIMDSKPCMIEEIIEQSEEMQALNPSSVNTIRINTILGKDGSTIVLFYPFLKIGRQGMKVDNAGAGGIVCGIDWKTGIIRTDGVDEKNLRYRVNPEFGYTFKGIQLPDWSNAIQMAIDLQKQFPNHRCTGWDFAHTKQGWILVEGNSGGQFVGQQMVDCIGHREELENLL